MNKGQAMFPTEAIERIVKLLQQQVMKMAEAVNLTLTLIPPPKKYDVSEDDVLSSAKLYIQNEGYPYTDLTLMIARSGPKGHSFTLTLPAEVAQVKAPPSHCSHFSPQPLR